MAIDIESALRDALGRDRYELRALRAENEALRVQRARSSVSLEIASGEAEGLRAELDEAGGELARVAAVEDPIAGVSQRALALLDRARESVAALGDGNGTGA